MTMADGPGRQLTARELPTNPFVDVAMILFLEDIAEKQGVEGLLTYMINQGAALAETMPLEDYGTWDDFVTALNEGRSILSALEGTQAFSRYVLVTPVNPFHEAYATYIRLMGELLPAHRDVVELYNGRVQNSAVESMSIVHQSFRRALVRRITVAGQAVRYAELGAKALDGTIIIAPEGWLEVLLEKAEITATQLQMAIRQNSNVILLYPPTAEMARVAETAGAAPRVLGVVEETEDLEVGAQQPTDGREPEPALQAAG